MSSESPLFQGYVVNAFKNDLTDLYLVRTRTHTHNILVRACCLSPRPLIKRKVWPVGGRRLLVHDINNGLTTCSSPCPEKIGARPVFHAYALVCTSDCS